ncbi:MAG: hypothetical protein JW959_12190 [Pirellulales bacterium]|nr:hypothetical protein [Pirellulales bacterium]
MCAIAGLCSSAGNTAGQAGSGAQRRKNLHRNEDGVISILAVFTVLALTVLLGMVMNVGRQADGKIRMQNAADAAAYSGAMELTRGMNTLSFTNRLLCEVFALTAILREGRDRNVESYLPRILDAWNNAADKFAEADLPMFADLARAIDEKTPDEQELADRYLAWIEGVSVLQLPAFESVLSGELIPKFQRALLQYYPDVAQEAADRAARLNGTPDFGRGAMRAALWRTTGELVACPALPVVDPTVDASYLDAAREQRNNWAHNYLNQWNAETMAFFDRFGGKMSRFGELWRGFTCGQLEKLIDEYPNSNLPMQIVVSTDSQNEYIETNFTFIATAYWSKTRVTAPNLFGNPIRGDVLVTYAQARVFVPERHLTYYWWSPSSSGVSVSLGGVPGEGPSLSLSAGSSAPGGGISQRYVGYESVPTDWTLFNQHWTCQLTPATAEMLPAILQTTPTTIPELGDKQLPSLGSMSLEEIQEISLH